MFPPGGETPLVFLAFRSKGPCTGLRRGEEQRCLDRRGREVTREDKGSLESILQMGPCNDTLSHVIENSEVHRWLWGTVWSFLHLFQRKKKRCSSFQTSLAIFCPRPPPHLLKELSSTVYYRQQAGNTQQKSLRAIFWPKLTNSSHLFQGQLNEDKLKGKLRSLENQLYACTQVSILEDTSSPGAWN